MWMPRMVASTVPPSGTGRYPYIRRSAWLTLIIRPFYCRTHSNKDRILAYTLISLSDRLPECLKR